MKLSDEVIYEKLISEQQLDPNKIAGVYLGLNNLATVTFNQADLKSLLINGKQLKAINQLFNSEYYWPSSPKRMIAMR